MVESPHAIAARHAACDAAEYAFWNADGDVMGCDKGETDTYVAITDDLVPSLVSSEDETACEDGIGDGEGATASTDNKS